ncbi:MAG: biopolymer transporter ExbD [Treponema sp.]|nr:biopolymer transporter ExbD [Treponema sp.]
MRIKRPKRQGFLETCAASDMAFLLIIYFLVIAGFNLNKGFLVTLPEKDSTREILREDLLRFEMDNDGNVLHEGIILNLNEARTIIQTAHAGNPGIAVIITISSQAVWQKVVSFIELAQDLMIESFSFSMKKDNT